MKGLLVMCLAWLPVFCWADTYVATTAQEIQSYTDSLQAGDTLLIQEGSYDINWDMQDLSGGPADWIVISAMSDSVVVNGTAYDNVIDVYNCHYVELKGLHITASNTGSGIDGIKFRTTSDNFLMENLDIHDLTGVGISANPAGQSFTYLSIRHCHIHDITDVGEGLYLGNHDGLSPVHHCLVEKNWIHDCHPHKGIQFKRGTYLNIIEDNVVYNCDEAGIVLYRTDQPTASDNNIVRRNAVWNAPEGIFAVGQTDIENNVVFDCSYGINVRNYSGWGMQDLYLRNNTIYSCATSCLRLDDWNVATGEMICINNACYQDLITQSAIQAPDGIGPGVVEKNRHYGQSEVSGSVLGNPPAEEFVNPDPTPGAIDLYPRAGSALVDSGSSAHGAPPDDYNVSSRPVAGIWDIGAYEWSQDSNPGWQVEEGFKETDTGAHEVEGFAQGKTRIAVSIRGNSVCFGLLPPGSALRVYDASGRAVHGSGPIAASQYTWDAERVPDGSYFVVITGETGLSLSTIKIALLR